MATTKKATKPRRKRPKGGHKRKTIVPKAPIRRLLKEHGAERVSASAIDEVLHQLNEIAKKSVRLSRHGKRKTVMRRDIPRVDGVQ
ncbi:MAG: histone [Candidatus Helarchaeota archaeon]